MKRLLYASLTGFGLTVLPMMILWLPADSGFVNSLKSAITILMLPGIYFGFVAAGGMIDDISLLVAGLCNFVLYSVLTYILLGVWERHRTKA